MFERPSKRARGNAEALVDLTSLMDIFSNILMFIIISSVFLKVTVIDIHLPKPARGRPGQSEKKEIKVLTLKIGDKGLKLGGNLGDSYSFMTVKGNGTYNYSKLSRYLKEIKEKNPDHRDVILLFKDSIRYNIIIKIIDATREQYIEEDGEKVRFDLFSNVSLGEYKEDDTIAEAEKK